MTYACSFCGTSRPPSPRVDDDVDVDVQEVDKLWASVESTRADLAPRKKFAFRTKTKTSGKSKSTSKSNNKRNNDAPNGEEAAAAAVRQRAAAGEAEDEAEEQDKGKDQDTVPRGGVGE